MKLIKELAIGAVIVIGALVLYVIFDTIRSAG